MRQIAGSGRLLRRACSLTLFVSMSVSAAMALSPANALADTASFTTQGCTAWTVPAGTSNVLIEATGAAGGLGLNGNPGGRGDAVSATLTGLSAGQSLDVCVDSGGGSGGAGGGAGGGASGVSLGTDFSSPVLVAGGGGGAAGRGILKTEVVPAIRAAKMVSVSSGPRPAGMAVRRRSARPEALQTPMAETAEVSASADRAPEVAVGAPQEPAVVTAAAITAVVAAVVAGS
jgi:hypothetical protein